MQDYSLYLVTDDKQDLNTLCRVVEQAIQGGVSIVQVREKHGDIRAFLERALTVKALLDGTGIPLIINDRVDVAIAIDADGVHLGQSDMPVDVARKLLGVNKIIGLSIEDPQQLLDAQTLPIDYIGLSAIYPTPTKTDTQRYWGLNGLRWARERFDKPIIAIGGLNTENIPATLEAGADGVAVVSAICHVDDVLASTQQLRQLVQYNLL